MLDTKDSCNIKLQHLQQVLIRHLRQADIYKRVCSELLLNTTDIEKQEEVVEVATMQKAWRNKDVSFIDTTIPINKLKCLL